MLTAFVFTGVALAAAFLWHLAKLLRVFYLSQQFPGPTPLPLIGNAYLFFFLKPEEVDYVVFDLLNKYGKTVKLWLGHTLSIFMSDLKDVEIVLGTNTMLDKSFEYGYLKPWLHEGLLVSKKEKWFKRRKVLTPAFHFKVLEQFVEIFDRESLIFTECLSKDARVSGIVDMGHWINLATLDVICGIIIIDSRPLWKWLLITVSIIGNAVGIGTLYLKAMQFIWKNK